MRLTSADSSEVPENVTFIGLHKDSPKADWAQLLVDIKDPLVSTREGTKVIAIDYETFAYKDCYKEQFLEDAQEEYLFKLAEFENGIRKTRPKPPNANTKSLPIDMHHSKIAGVVICARPQRSYYLNFAHSDRDGLKPVCDEEHQNQLLHWVFSHAPEGTEYIAHNAWFEYNISFVNGIDVWEKGATRYQGGFIDTMILAKLFNFESVSLKKLTKSLFKWDQMEYLEAIRVNHLAPKLSEILGVSDPAKIRYLIKNIEGKSAPKLPGKTYDRIGISIDRKTLSQINKLIKEVDEEFFGMDANTLTEVLPYAAQDGYWTLCLFNSLHKAAKESKTNNKILPDLWDYYRKIEHPIIKCVSDMSFIGTRIDLDFIQTLREICQAKIDEYREKFKEAVIADLELRFPRLKEGTFSGVSELLSYLAVEARKWDPDSYDYLESWIPTKLGISNWDDLVLWVNNCDPCNLSTQKEVFFRVLGLPVYKETDAGGASLDKKVCPRYSLVSKSAQVLMQLRKVMQIQSLYAYPYPRLLHSKTNRVHSATMLSGAGTGRFTMKHPNLQQMSKRFKTSMDRELSIRKSILPLDDDSVILAPDFSQIELRYMAEVSGDPDMLECYTGDSQGKFVDIHTKTCESIFSAAYAHLEGDERKNAFKEYRNHAKQINFLSIYQGSGYALLEQFYETEVFDFDLFQAKQFLIDWYKVYPEVGTFNAEYGYHVAPALGYGETDFGRRRYLDFPSYDRGLFSRAVRQACNHVIQGTCAEIMKITIARLYWDPILRDLGAQVLLSIHDEVLINVPKKTLAYVVPVVEKAFTEFPFGVPLKTSVDAGHNFGTLQALQETPDGGIDWTHFEAWVQEVTGLPCPQDYKRYAHTYGEQWLTCSKAASKTWLSAHGTA